LIKNLFVYGTLKTGEVNNHLLRSCEQQGIGVVSNSALLDLSACPGLLLGTFSKEHWAKGEVYTFENPDVLRSLDTLEQEGKLYKRIITPVAMKDKVVLCWTYVLLLPIPVKKLIRKGNWRSL